MDDEKKSFTFIWKIKHVSIFHRLKLWLFLSERISSPKFSFVHDVDGSHWCLFFYHNYAKDKSCVACRLEQWRLNGDLIPTPTELDYELSFLAGDGSVLHSKTFLKQKFDINVPFDDLPLLMKADEVFVHKKDMFIPDDTLTIRCRIWNIQESHLISDSCLAETRIKEKVYSFEGTLEKFSNIEPSHKNTIYTKSSSLNINLSLNLWVAADGKLSVEMNIALPFRYKYKIFFINAVGERIKCGKGEFFGGELNCIPLTLSKEFLIKNKTLYLPEDVLTIYCEVINPVVDKISEMEYKFDYPDAQEAICNATTHNADVYCDEYDTKNFSTLKDGLLSLFSEGTLCDVKLKTSTETFSAHKNVLSARSPVFKSMFVTDMREKMNGCVDIDDLEAETVRRMLLFMYSDTLGDLEYDSAKHLYFAADKYNIVPLKYRCSNFLKQNLQQANCCDVLLLSDRHQDRGLKLAAQDYIAENEEAVLLSDEWKNLEKNHAQLSIEVFRVIVMKKRKKLGHFQLPRGRT